MLNYLTGINDREKKLENQLNIFWMMVLIVVELLNEPTRVRVVG